MMIRQNIKISGPPYCCGERERVPSYRRPNLDGNSNVAGDHSLHPIFNGHQDRREFQK